MKRLKTAAKWAAFLAFLALAAWFWMQMPVRITDASGEDVEYIEIFNGNNGERAVIEDPETIAVIMEDLRDVKVQRKRISSGYKGYSLRITIHYKNFTLFPWKEFIVNTSTVLRNDPFFYEVVQGDIDYYHLVSFVCEPEEDPSAQPES